MDHAATMRCLLDAISARDVEQFRALLADDFIEHEVPPGLTSTKEGITTFFRMYLAAFPDLHMEPADVFTSGDTVVARVRLTGTHDGAFMGLSPTGRRIEMLLIDIIRFGPDGRAQEHWGSFDQLMMLQQLGAIPTGPPA